MKRKGNPRFKKVKRKGRMVYVLKKKAVKKKATKKRTTKKKTTKKRR